MNGNGNNGNGKAKLVASGFLAKGKDEQGRPCVVKDEAGHWQHQVAAIFFRESDFGSYFSAKVGLGDGAVSAAVRPVYGIFTIPAKDPATGKRNFGKERLLGIYEEIHPESGSKPFGKMILVKGDQVKPVVPPPRMLSRTCPPGRPRRRSSPPATSRWTTRCPSRYLATSARPAPRSGSRSGRRDRS
ncbi:MAG: hypothetical protein U0166_02895 [Acidobacteriota bacterium]